MNKLRIYLRMHKITMRRLSELSGIGYNAVQKMLHGDYSPTLEQAMRICKAVGIRPSDMASTLLDLPNNEWR